MNTATGAARWTFKLGDEVRASSPAVDANGVIYIGAYDGLVYAVNPDGTLKRTWATGALIRSSPAIAGRTLYLGSNDDRLYAFDIGATSSSLWSQYRQNPRRTGRASLSVTASPQSQIAAMGGSLSLSVNAAGDGPLTYQWFKDGIAIAGATGSTLVVNPVTAASAGAYHVTINDAQGSVTTSPASVTVESASLGRLTNLSVRTPAGTGDQTLTVGFVLTGAPDKDVLIRAIGPTLTEFGVTSTLADPRLQLFSGTTVLSTNDNWAAPAAGNSSVAALTSAFTATGAFALRNDALDAALLRPMAAGGYTAQITGNAGTGIALAELYDTAADRGARLVNVSARAQVGTGGSILIAGFTISGNVPKPVLIRAVGPTLGAFNVSGFLINPRLDLYRGSTLVQGNDDWGGTAALVTAFGQVSAFALSAASSLDAALLVTLAPGSYTAQVSGVNGTTGVALVEVYEMP